MPATPTVIGQPRQNTPGQINARLADYEREERIAQANARKEQAKADAAAKAEQKAREKKEAADRKAAERKALLEDRERLRNEKQSHELAKIKAKSAPLETLNTLLTSVENIQRQVQGTQETVGAIGTVAASTAAKPKLDVKSLLPVILIGGGLLAWFLFKR